MQVQSVAGTGDNPYTNALVAVKWLGTTLHYSFPTQDQYTGYDPGEEPYQNFEVLAPAQQAAVRAALAMISTFTNLTFTESSGAAAGDAELRFGQSDAADVAFGYFPAPVPLGGDAWFNNSANYFDNPQLGNYAFFSFMHEIGHTLGLGHPHEAAQPMPSDRDWIGYTLMSYRSTEGAGLGYVGNFFPQSYMMEDIRALQLMYGANYAYQADDSVYTFNFTTGEMFINGVGQGAPESGRLYRTLWDGGGNDTLDFSAYSGGGITVDLRPGARSSIFKTGGNHSLALAHLFGNDPRSLIENVIAGPAAITITGNDAANRLTGGAGNDTIRGGAGDDVISGGGGNDNLYGDQGNDLLTAGPASSNLYGGTGDDVLTASASGSNQYGEDGADQLNGGEGIDSLSGGSGVDILRAGGGDDRLDGGADNDLLEGGTGDDTLDGGTGADQMIGGSGSDTYYLDDAGDTFLENVADAGTDKLVTTISVLASAGIETIEALGFANLTLIGNASNNVIVGNFGNNLIDGGAGADRMTGGAGDDTFIVDDPDDLVYDLAAGTDTVRSSVSFVLPVYMSDPYAGASLGVAQPYYPIEVLILTGSAAINGTGQVLADTIIGNDSSNILDGRDGNDLLTGGGGADTLWGGNGADRFIYLAQADSAAAAPDWLRDFQHGTDTVDLRALTLTDISFTPQAAGEAYGTVNITLAAGGAMALRVTGVIDLSDILYSGSLSGAAGQTLLGTEANDVLTGSDGNDTLIGYGGNDHMAGGRGNDLYFVDSMEDIVSESPGEGTDRIAASSSYFLRSGVSVEVLEPVTYNSTDPLNFYGNELANELRGNNGANAFDAGPGADTIHAQAGDDFLNGGAGADAMYGGPGNDTYFVDEAGDRIFELPGQGYDRVAPGVDYTIPDDAEIELIEAITLSSTAALNLGGSNTANTIYGNQGSNILRGYGGNDLLYGFGGDDFLDGGSGADVMEGGMGNDTYYVDNLSDQVIELAGQGTDRVAGTIDYVAPLDAEIELIESLNTNWLGGLNLTGSNSANRITGDGGGNVLRGLGGDDALFGLGGDDQLHGGTGANVLYGGAGNDQYFLESDQDRVVELAGEGFDTAFVSFSFTLPDEFENLYARDLLALGAYNLVGNQLSNVMRGNGDANRLDGKAGTDRLIGGGGADMFAFSTALSAANIDAVEDFARGVDRIGLDHAIFTRFNPGSLDAAFLRVGEAAADADDFIIYNPNGGLLFYDADGNGAGAAVQFATLSATPTLSAVDFVIL